MASYFPEESSRLLKIAIALWLLSFVLPSIKSSEESLGFLLFWLALFSGHPYAMLSALSNVALLMVCFPRFRQLKRLMALVLWSLFGFNLLWLSHQDLTQQLGLGYYIWLSSFLLGGLAIIKLKS
ncbi:MAG: hypothetical protein R2865_07725 [Deinococcales bacterium]